MPAFAADAFTALSSGFGRRMLTRSLLGWNSKRTVLRPVRSYSVRSAVATNFSASLSLRSLGSFFFIVFDLFPVHVAGADRPEKRFATPLPQGKHDQNAAVSIRLAD